MSWSSNVGKLLTRGRYIHLAGVRPIIKAVYGRDRTPILRVGGGSYENAGREVFGSFLQVWGLLGCMGFCDVVAKFLKTRLKILSDA